MSPVPHWWWMAVESHRRVTNLRSVNSCAGKLPRINENIDQLLEIGVKFIYNLNV